MKFRIHAPIVLVPTAEAKQAIGAYLASAGQAAYREVALAAKGLEIAHLQFGPVTAKLCRMATCLNVI